MLAFPCDCAVPGGFCVDQPAGPAAERHQRGVQAAVRADPGQRDPAARAVAAEEGGQRAGRGDGRPADRGDDVPGEQAGLIGRASRREPRPPARRTWPGRCWPGPPWCRRWCSRCRCRSRRRSAGVPGWPAAGDRCWCCPGGARRGTRAGRSGSGALAARPRSAWRSAGPGRWGWRSRNRRCFPPAAVSIPITWPSASASGPPESPGRMSALVCSMPCRVSVRPELWSLATMVRSRLLITPGATVGEPPCPPSLPMARTGVPTRTRAELPIVTALSRGAPCTWSRATSSVAVVAEDPRRIALARRHRRDRDAGRAVDDVVVGQHQPGRGVDDEARALRRLLQVLQVGGHVHDAGLDRVVDGLVVQRGRWPVRRGVARHPGGARAGRR